MFTAVSMNFLTSVMQIYFHKLQKLVGELEQMYYSSSLTAESGTQYLHQHCRDFNDIYRKFLDSFSSFQERYT